MQKSIRGYINKHSISLNIDEKIYENNFPIIGMKISINIIYIHFMSTLELTRNCVCDNIPKATSKVLKFLTGTYTRTNKKVVILSQTPQLVKYLQKFQNLFYLSQIHSWSSKAPSLAKDINTSVNCHSKVHHTIIYIYEYADVTEKFEYLSFLFSNESVEHSNYGHVVNSN